MFPHLSFCCCEPDGDKSNRWKIKKSYCNRTIWPFHTFYMFACNFSKNLKRKHWRPDCDGLPALQCLWRQRHTGCHLEYKRRWIRSSGKLQRVKSVSGIPCSNLHDAAQAVYDLGNISKTEKDTKKKTKENKSLLQLHKASPYIVPQLFIVISSLNVLFCAAVWFSLCVIGLSFPSLFVGSDVISSSECDWMEQLSLDAAEEFLPLLSYMYINSCHTL